MSSNSPLMSRRWAAMSSRMTSSPAARDDTFVEGTRSMRRMQAERGSSYPLDSPVDSPLVRRAAVSLLLGVPSSNQSLNDSVASFSLDETTTDESSRTSPRGDLSPEPSGALHHHHVKKGYKNELWTAIKSNYMYLMDEEIIDACKLTESELSSDDLSTESKVSYNEFLQQYKELTDWLEHIQLVLCRQTASLSENYLNQMYQEELLNESPRQRLFNDYARQLIHRYPQLKAEISSRLSHVNKLWTEVMDRLAVPSGEGGGAGRRDPQKVLNDIEADLSSLREWVSGMEKSLSKLYLHSDWSVNILHQKLTEHQRVQQDIESRSRVVSAILKLCKWLAMAKVESPVVSGTEAEMSPLALVQAEAERLEQRWHAIWLQSIEWQLRLEDAVNGRNRRLSGLCDATDNQVDLRQMSADRPRIVSVAAKRHCTVVSPAELVAHESDASVGSDIIPFRDSEYESIGDDDLMVQYLERSDSEQLDETNHYLSEGSDIHSEEEEEVSLGSESRVAEEDGARKLKATSEESVTGGVDSCLGRSVSNPSLQMDPHTSLSPGVVVIGTSGTDTCEESLRSEVPDVGYSSECQSNEEADSLVGRRVPSLGPVVEVAGRKMDTGTCDLIINKADVVKVSTQATLATSAYNSASDLSDGHHGGIAIGNNASVIGETSDNDMVAAFYYLTAPIDRSVSGAADSCGAKLFPGMRCELMKGDETDDDVARMVELPLDAECTREYADLWRSFGEVTAAGVVGCGRRIHGRSLDSLAPLGTDKVLTIDKRVSSVEVIMDSFPATPNENDGTIGRLSAVGGLSSEQMLLHGAENGIRLKTLAPLSSCDASSEGTVSDSELSELNVSSEDDNCTAAISCHRRRRTLAKRAQKSGGSVRSSPLKLAGSQPMKSPMKRRSDPGTTDPTIVDLPLPLRSVSDGEIFGAVTGCSTTKRSKLSRVVICSGSSQRLNGDRARKTSSLSTVDGVASFRAKKKTSSVQSHVRTLDFDDVPDAGSGEDSLQLSFSANDKIISANRLSSELYRGQQTLYADMSSDLDAIVPDLDLGGSLTSVTADHSLNDDDYQDLHNSSDANHRDNAQNNMTSDDWCDSAEHDYNSMDMSLYDSHDDKIHDLGNVTQHRRPATTKLMMSRAYIEESDSDTEDFLNIVSESRKALRFTESALAQFRNDHVTGAVVHDPVEYMGPLATCQTNINCLLELVDALESGNRVSDVDGKIHQITDIVQRWRSLEAQTVMQQHECRELYILHIERVRAEKELDMISKQIEFDGFDDIVALETGIRTLQTTSSELLTRVGQQLDAVDQRVIRYHLSHQDVDLSRLMASIQSLRQSRTMLIERCGSVESRLKEALMSWYQLNELERHLLYVIGHEQHQLECLDVAKDIVHLSEHDCSETIGDLKVLREGWSVHSTKLQLMQSLADDLHDVCTQCAHSLLSATVGAIAGDLRALHVKCDEIVAHLDESRHHQKICSEDEEVDITADDDFEPLSDDTDMDLLDSHHSDTVAETAAAAVEFCLPVVECMVMSQVESPAGHVVSASMKTSSETSLLEKIAELEEKLLLATSTKETALAAGGIQHQLQYDKMDVSEEFITKFDADSQLTEPDTLLNTTQQVDKAVALVRPAVAAAAGSKVSVLRRLLKYALPLPLFLIILFGSLYILFDDWLSELDHYGLVINPQLSHVHPPPV